MHGGCGFTQEPVSFTDDPEALLLPVSPITYTFVVTTALIVGIIH